MTKGYQGEGTMACAIYKSSHSALKPRVVLGNAHREVRRIMDSPAPRMGKNSLPIYTARFKLQNCLILGI